MKILFYGAKPYDVESFDQLLPEYPGLEVKYIEANLVPETAPLAQGYDGVCAFVNADLSGAVIDRLAQCGIKVILMRCAGYNNVDLKAAARHQIPVLRVPGYSPRRWRSTPWPWPSPPTATPTRPISSAGRTTSPSPD